LPVPTETSVPAKKHSLFDRLAIRAITAYGALTALILLLIPTVYIPAEDSVILYLFSRNLAQHGAITFFAFGPHAEGATDFLWMVMIAGGIKLGLPPFWAASLINFVSVFALGLVLARIARVRPSPLFLLLIAGVFGMLPQFSAALQGFSVLPFALLLATLALCFLEGNDLFLPLVSLALCLFRPDGVVFAIPTLLAALIVYPRRGRRFALDLALFVVPGLAYFLWRWHYFGQLLPLPFLVKSNAIRVAHFLVVGSLIDSSHFLIFTLVVLAIALAGRMKSVQNWAILLCLLVLPNLFYFAMRLDQDVGLRFFVFYPVGIAVLLAMNWRDIQPRHSLILRVALGCWILLLFNRAGRELHLSWGMQYTNRKAIGSELSHLPNGTLLTTEAGIIPFYSGWKTFDAWGLNTEQFATHLLQPADVASVHPDVIMLHTGDRPPECVVSPSWQTPYQVREWHNMTRNLVTGADLAHYDLWLAPLSHAKEYEAGTLAPWDADQDCWLIRRDSPLRQDIEQALAHHGGNPVEVFSQHVSLNTSPGGDKNESAGPEVHGLKAILTRAWHALN
jgi:hypothetical protein